MTHQIIATIGLFLGVVYGTGVIGLVYYKKNVSAPRVWMMSLGFTTFIAAMWIFN